MAKLGMTTLPPARTAAFRMSRNSLSMVSSGSWSAVAVGGFHEHPVGLVAGRGIVEERLVPPADVAREEDRARLGPASHADADRGGPEDVTRLEELRLDPVGDPHGLPELGDREPPSRLLGVLLGVQRHRRAGRACAPPSRGGTACAPRPPPGSAPSRASRCGRSRPSARCRTPVPGTPASPAGAAGRSGRGARGSGARRPGGRAAPAGAPSSATAGRVPAAGRSRRARARVRCPAGSASRSRTVRRRGR